jgi:hypothetical protein
MGSNDTTNSFLASDQTGEGNCIFRSQVTPCSDFSNVTVLEAIQKAWIDEAG